MTATKTQLTAEQIINLDTPTYDRPVLRKAVAQAIKTAIPVDVLAGGYRWNLVTALIDAYHTGGMETVLKDTGLLDNGTVASLARDVTDAITNAERTITTEHVMRNAAVSTPTGVQYLVGASYSARGTQFSTAPTRDDDDERITDWRREQLELHTDH